MQARSLKYCAFLVLGALALAVGCASEPQVVPSSGIRPPTTADQVKIYQKAPKRYELLGEVSVAPSNTVRWDERGNADAGFEQLKSAAAARGANGLLLAADKDAGPQQLILAGYKGEYFQVRMREEPRSAVAQAIWVLEEK